MTGVQTTKGRTGAKLTVTGANTLTLLRWYGTLGLKGRNAGCTRT